MKKLLASWVSAFLLFSGFAAVGPPAQAAEPYPGTIATALSVSYKARVHRARIQRVTADVITSGNATPVGTVTTTITRVKSGRTYTASRSYAGGTATYLSPRLTKRGLWRLKVTFTPAANSVYKAASYERYFKVKKRRYI